jgi:ribosomal protein S18 acetylase RimI-like enzyme
VTPDVSIRPTTEDDVEAVQRVARAAWHAAYDPVLGADRVDETVDAWYDPESLVTDDVEAEDRPFFVAVLDGTVVGFAEAAPDDDEDPLAHLYRIYVDPDHWGIGIGGSLLERVESVLPERGFEFLRLSVLAENEVGIGFYEGNGFERVGTAHNDLLDVEEYHYSKRL